MKTILTFDIGTTAIKTCIFDEKLKALEKRTDEYSLQGEDGRVELDSEIYWETMCHAVAAIGEKISMASVEAICLTTQGETMIPVTKEGQALHRAVVWLDDRAGKQAEEISQKYTKDEIYHLTGVTDMNGFVPLPKLLWFKQERPEIYENTYKFLLLEDYLLYRLTGRFATEKTLLTSTAYYDIRNDRYWTEILEDFGLDTEKLPEILDSGELAGTVSAPAAEKLGLSTDVKVFAGAMDQIAAAIGGGGLQEGIVTATVGTCMALTSAVSSMEECTDDSLILYRGINENQYVMLPLCNTAGSVFKWFKDQCCQMEVKQCREDGTDVYDKLCGYAAEVPAGAEGVVLLPYFAGSMQPRLIPEAKGVFCGLGITTDRKIMTRAVLESIGYMLRENMEMFEQFGSRATRVHFFGGGSKNRIWNQIIADIANVELVLLEEGECASLGAAILAAVSLGWYSDIKEGQKCNSIREIIKPDKSLKEVYDVAYTRYKKLFDSVAPIFAEMK